jgi:hypothetical protein
LLETYDKMMAALWLVLIPSFLNYLIPLTWLMEYVLVSGTRRKPEGWKFDNFNDLLLLVTTILIQWELQSKLNKPDPNNRLIGKGFTTN